MVDLIAKSPLYGLLPVQIGAHSLQEADLGPMTSIMPLRGASGPDRAVGLELPALGQTSQGENCHLMWFGRGQFLLVGVEPPAGLQGHAALSDQSDAWAVADLSGPQTEAVLARLVPIDLRAAAFPVGSVARTLIGHMNGAVIRLSDTSFRLMVFRSMAKTLTHDLTEAMHTIAAWEMT